VPVVAELPISAVLGPKLSTVGGVARMPCPSWTGAGLFSA
jgi:hypothetical protein